MSISGFGTGVTLDDTAQIVNQVINEVTEGPNSWTPVADGLTAVGTPTLAGVYYVIGKMYFVELTITADTSTAAVAGTTFITGLPGTIQRDSTCSVALASVLSLGVGIVRASNSRLYVPTWTTTSETVTITMMYQGAA